jgi:gliding motility-associated-like protein
MLLNVVEIFAQINNYFSIGESVQFDVNPSPGTSYCWKVTENAFQINGGESEKVTFLSPKCQSTLSLKWENAGTYYISVTADNQNGCSNIKVYPIVVGKNHIPVAMDDYVSSDWLKYIRIDLLGNDYDAKCDLDTSSLKILTKTEFGQITLGPAGTINYFPQISHAGNDRFYYRICDLCNQCDTAMVSIDLIDPPLYIPEGISPNGDGINDHFVINGLISYPKSSLSIFSRDGVIVYHSDDYQNDWGGVPNNRKFSSRAVSSGTYYYLLQLGGTKRVIKRYIFIAD